MKIVVISNTYPPLQRGGAEVVAQRMVSGLRAAGHEVSVITLAPSAGTSAAAPVMTVEQGVRIYRFVPRNIYHYMDAHRKPILARYLWHLINFFNIHSAAVVEDILRTEKPDVVITHNLMGLGFLLPRSIHRQGIRHVHVLHDVQLYHPSGVLYVGSEHSLYARLGSILGYFFCTRFMFKKVDVFITPSHFLKMFYAERGFFRKDNVQVLPSPVNMPARARDVSSSGPLRAASIGTVSEAKGIPQACAALYDLLHEGTIHYHVIGAGPVLATLQRQYASERSITFHGWQDSQALASLYSMIDVLVVPSMLYDASPTVIYEALSYGIPVIATASGGASEIIVGGKTGWLCAPGDWRRLAQLVAHAASKRAVIQDMSAACRDTVADYSLEKYTARLEAVIRT